MGLVFGEVTFDGSAPDLSRIVEKMAEISGLEVSVQDADADEKGELLDMCAELAFACAPEEQIQVRTYRSGAVKEWADKEWGDEEGDPLPFAQAVQGYHVTDETQVVYLKSYLGLEPTLLVVVLLALEALGGHLDDPIPEDWRREYGQPVTLADLQRRRRKARRCVRMGCAVQVLLLPVTIPLCLLSFLLSMITMPWRIWRAYKLCRDRGWLPPDP